MLKRSLSDLEFPKILESIHKKSISDIGKIKLSSDAITTSKKIIEDRVKRIEEIHIKKAKAEFQLSYFPSLKNVFDYAKTTGASFYGKDLLTVGEFLHSLSLLSIFLEDEDLLKPDEKKVKEEILYSLDGEGEVRDTHPRLVPLVKKLERIKNDRYKFSQTFLSQNQSISQNNQAIYRNERVVLPIKADSKKEVSGYVSGSSASGSTLYMEPFELVELNNGVILAEQAIFQEKNKIINELSIITRDILGLLKIREDFVSDFDFHYALSEYVLEIKATKCINSEDIKLIGARHPLLFDKVVPVTIEIDKDTKTVVLSGANAGGKTVTMKTVALFVVLNQLCGFIPAEKGSKLPIFNNIYTDIGDHQSILDEFSTFSSHMDNVAFICKNVTNNSLVLLDELGSGTDPDEGAALSIAILNFLKDRAALTFITSHYAKVKQYAYANDFMMNASMEFDEEENRPTYRVIPGLPGDSHAILIADRMGIPKNIIKDAKANLSSENQSIAKLIQDLVSRQRALDRKIGQAENERVNNRREREFNSKIKEDLEKAKLEIKTERKDELAIFLKQTRKELEKLVKDIQTGELTKEKTKRVKTFIEKLNTKDQEVDKEIAEIQEKKMPKVNYEFKVGDEVLCGNFKRKGILLKKEGKSKWLVSLDSLKMTLDEKDLEPISEDAKTKVYVPIAISTKKPKSNLDVRGKRLEETLEIIEEEIEACLVHNLNMFSIIHGYGTGRLSVGIHSYLKKQKNVKEYYFATPEDGGMGKTYVILT